MPRADMAPITRTVLTGGVEGARLPRGGCVSWRTGHRGKECPRSGYDLRPFRDFGLGVPGLRPHWTPLDSPMQGRVSSLAQAPRLGLGCGWLTGRGHRSGDPRPATAGQTGSSSEFCNLEIKKQVLLATPLKVLCDMVWYCFSLNHCRRRQCRCTGLCRALQDGQHRAGRNPSLPDHSCPGLRRELRVCVCVYMCALHVCACMCALHVSPCPLTCCVQCGLGSCCRNGAPDRCRGTIKVAPATGKLGCIQAPPGSSQMRGAVVSGVPPRSGSRCDLVACRSPAGSLQPGATTAPLAPTDMVRRPAGGTRDSQPSWNCVCPFPGPQPLAPSWPLADGGAAGFLGQGSTLDIPASTGASPLTSHSCACRCWAGRTRNRQ